MLYKIILNQIKEYEMKDWIIGIIIFLGHFCFSWFYLPSLKTDIIAFQLLYCIAFLFLFCIFMQSKDENEFLIKNIVFYAFNTIIMCISYKICPKMFFKSYNVLAILPNLTFSTSLFVYYLQHFNKNRDDEQLNLTPFLLTIISFLLFLFSAIIGNQAVSDVFNLPAGDLPITASFTIIVVLIILTLFVNIGSCIFVCLSLIVNRNYLYMFLWVVLLVVIILNCRFIVDYKTLVDKDSNKENSKSFTTENVERLLKNMAYEADFQYLGSYFSVVKISDEKMKTLLTDKDKTTARVKLHENGHISLMCMPNNVLSEKIHVFKYDDLEKQETEKQETKWSEITNDCLRNG